MNKQLQNLLNQTSADFNWDADNKTWCLSGVDRGNYWETDDLEAGTVEQAEQDAIDMLEEQLRPKQWWE